eukprot:453518_1
MSESSKFQKEAKGHKTDKLSMKNPPNMFIRIFSTIMIVIGITLYSTVGILIRLSMKNTDHVPYNSSFVMCLIEAGKFTTSLILLTKTEGISQAITFIKYVSFRERFLFCIPAIIYSITNNLGFYILQYMDPGSNSVLAQTKIIVTTCMWSYWFRKRINKQQIISLFLLFCGSMLVAWPSHSNNKQMYVIWPMGPIMLTIQISLSSLACIYTEWVYKKNGNHTNRSMHLDNLHLYFWGILCNMFQFYYTNQKHPISGFNIYTYLIIINNIALGLIIGFILQYFNNIIKLMMSGTSIVLSAILTFFIFGLNWTMTYGIGLFIVVCSLLVFKLQIDIQVRHFVFLFTILAIVYTQNILHIHIKPTSVQMNVNNALYSVFKNCTFNNATAHFECPKGINYYYYLYSSNNTNDITNMNCYWIEDTELKSFWKCESYIADFNSKINTNISECAVVLNSDSLLLKKYGKEIDSHSIVYRINFPPTKGYEKYVGNKTTSVVMDKQIINECNERIGYNKCSNNIITLMYSLKQCNDVDLYGLYNNKCLPEYYYDTPNRKCNTTLYQTEHYTIRNMSQAFNNLNIIL